MDCGNFTRNSCPMQRRVTKIIESIYGEAICQESLDLFQIARFGRTMQTLIFIPISMFIARLRHVQRIAEKLPGASHVKFLVSSAPSRDIVSHLSFQQVPDLRASGQHSEVRRLMQGD